jgi:hypothetical protein
MLLYVALSSTKPVQDGGSIALSAGSPEGEVTEHQLWAWKEEEGLEHSTCQGLLPPQRQEACALGHRLAKLVPGAAVWLPTGQCNGMLCPSLSHPHHCSVCGRLTLLLGISPKAQGVCSWLMTVEAEGWWGPAGRSLSNDVFHHHSRGQKCKSGDWTQ